MFKLSQIWLITRVPASWFLYHFRLSVQIKHLLPFMGTFGCSRLNLFFSCSDTGIIWFRKPFLLLPFSAKHLEKPRSYTKCAHSYAKSLVPGLFSRRDVFKYVHNDNCIHMRLFCSFHLYIPSSMGRTLTVPIYALSCSVSESIENSIKIAINKLTKQAGYSFSLSLQSIYHLSCRLKSVFKD